MSSLADLKATTFLYYTFMTIASIYLASFILRFIKDKSKGSVHLANARKKRMQRDEQIKNINIPKINISKQLEEKILNSDATSLLELLKKGETTSEQILIVYFKRTITIGLDLELITEINFEEALAQARNCDKLRKENPSACTGLLFGLPMSIKDNFVVKGTDTGGGIACRVFNPAPDDGIVAKVFKNQGAIIYVKSNIPQIMMTIESTNHIWGTSKNPWDKTRSAGGSSGGEGGLIAARCSPFGVGTDIGGSIRIPAAFNGVIGFKPTAERLMGTGRIVLGSILSNVINMKAAIGPLVKTVRDVNLMMKALLNESIYKAVKLSERDAYYTIKEWQEEIALKKQKMRIGYFKNMEFFPATPANQRVVDEAVQALKKRGYDLVEVNFPNLEEIVLLYLEILPSRGNEFLKDILEGEPCIKEYAWTKWASSLPNCLRTPIKMVLNLLGEKRLGLLVERTRQTDAHGFLKLIGRQNQAKKDFFKTWEANKLDAIVLPSFAHPALKVGTLIDFQLESVYTLILNLLNMPSGFVPTSVVKPGEDVYPKENSKYHDMIYRKVAEGMKGSVGLPIGVQIATLPWEDEKCVSIMLQLEEEVQFVKKHPYPM